MPKLELSVLSVGKSSQILFSHSPSWPSKQSPYPKDFNSYGFLKLYSPLHLYRYQSSSDSLCTFSINSPSIAVLAIYCCTINYLKTYKLKRAINRISLVQETLRYLFLCCFYLRLLLCLKCPCPLGHTSSPTFIFLPK